MKDGLTQRDRSKRLHSAHRLAFIQDDMPALLQQAQAISSFIHYYNLDLHRDGHFDQLLNELIALNSSGHAVNPPFDGNMEPAQALLYSFTTHLQHIAHAFNKRWKGFSNWYVDQALQVASEKIDPDRVWINIVPHAFQHFSLAKGTGFTYDKSLPDSSIRYRLAEAHAVSNVEIEKIYALCFERDKEVFPANWFKATTSVMMKDVMGETDTNQMLFGRMKSKQHKQPMGLQVVSQTLLLREGERVVMLTFELDQPYKQHFSEKRKVNELINKIRKETVGSISWKAAKEMVLMKALNNIFYLEISTQQGWTPIPKYTLQKINGSKGLMLKLQLTEQFPATTPCTTASHGMQTSAPSLKILLNRDSWFFPYVWLKKLMLNKIGINVRAEGISNLLLYNELGKIDNAAPFAPFGIHTERGAWFAMGNYEMASKDTRLVELSVRWQQLPVHEGGLYSHYKAYGEDIDNCSFRLKPRYLTNYRWKETKNDTPLYLFQTQLTSKKNGQPVAIGKLAEESTWKGIFVEDMPLYSQPENTYDYNITSKNGFIRFNLVEPVMGFGEKTYRQLFTASIIKKALKKKEEQLLHEPISPLMERITLSYEAQEEINLLIDAKAPGTALYHIYPLGTELVYPMAEKRAIPFVFSLAYDAYLLLALSQVRGNQELSLYFEFSSQNREVRLEQLPQVVWYWGIGYHWQKLPASAVVVDTTMNMITSGQIKIRLPEIPSAFLVEGRQLWLRAAIMENAEQIAFLKHVYTNAAQVFRDTADLNKTRQADYTINVSEASLPQVKQVQQISRFIGRPKEEQQEEKLMRVSEYVTHRGRAVSCRDYERIALQAFPELQKARCINENTKAERDMSDGLSTVTLVVIPHGPTAEDRLRPSAPPDLLLRVEDYFKTRMSAYIKQLDAINPVYVEIMVRCQVELEGPLMSADFQNKISTVIDHIIAPWQSGNKPPLFGYCFSLRTLAQQIQQVAQVKSIVQLSAVQVVDDSMEKHQGSHYIIQAYHRLEDEIRPQNAYSIMVPAAEHSIASTLEKEFGIEEMKIDENFVIWQDETETP